MFLFRPSNNNQRYAFVPLLDQSDNDNDDFDDDEDKGGKLNTIDNVHWYCNFVFFKQKFLIVYLLNIEKHRS